MGYHVAILRTSNGLPKPITAEEIAGVISSLTGFDFTGKEYVTETVTDKNGKFHFNALYTKSVNTFLPSAKMVTQTITFSSQGKEYLGWHFVKGNYDYNGELNDLDSSSELVPFELSCDFNNDENFVGITDSPSGSGYTGICRVNKK